MRDTLVPEGITVTTIFPGYVTTPMTDSHAGPRPI
jgi:NAD(P)-dependent dehydrogenase (short-subunit alcohol dehydrogenase family)